VSKKACCYKHAGGRGRAPTRAERGGHPDNRLQEKKKLCKEKEDETRTKHANEGKQHGESIPVIRKKRRHDNSNKNKDSGSEKYPQRRRQRNKGQKTIGDPYCREGDNPAQKELRKWKERKISIKRKRGSDKTQASESGKSNKVEKERWEKGEEKGGGGGEERGEGRSGGQVYDTSHVSRVALT